MPPAVPRRVVGDPVRLRQVLQNLIGNALKFTDAGSVELTVSSGASEGTLRFEVRDTGIGLSPFEQSSLVEVELELSRLQKRVAELEMLKQQLSDPSRQV